ncbi:hypothetical protein [Streptomyces chartreusis]
MTRIRRERTKSAVIAGAVLAGLLAGAPSTAVAADAGGDAGPLGRCDRVWVKNVYSYKSKFFGKGPVYSDGPGGKMTLTKIEAGEMGTQITGTVGVSVKAAVAEAKAEVSASAQTKATWTSSHSYEHKIKSNKYGNVQYGVKGHTAKVEKYLTLPDCSKSQRKTGTVKLANKRQGFRYWETNS